MANAAQILNEVYFLPTDKLVQSGQVRSLYNDRKCGQCPRVFRKVFGLGRHLQQAHGGHRQAFDYATTTRIELPNVRASSPVRRRHFSSTRASFPSTTVPVAKKRLSLEDIDPTGEDDDNWVPGKKERRMVGNKWLAASTPANPMALRKSRSRVPRTLFNDTDEEDDDDVVEIDVDDDNAVPKKSKIRKSPNDIAHPEGPNNPEEGESGTDMEYDIIEETGQSPSLSNTTGDSGLGPTEDADGEHLTVDCDPIIHDDLFEDAYQSRSDVIDLESDCDDTESVRSLASSSALSDGSVVEILSSNSSTASNEENIRGKGRSTGALIRDINDKIPLVRLERISLPKAAFVTGTYNVGNSAALQRLTEPKNASSAKKSATGEGRTSAQEVATTSCHDSVREFLAAGSDNDDDLDIIEVTPIDKTRKTSPSVEAKIEELLSGLIYFAVNMVESKTGNAQVLAESVVDDLIADSVRRVEQRKRSATQEASGLSSADPSTDPERRVDQEVTEWLHGCAKTQDLEEDKVSSCNEVSKNISSAEEQKDIEDGTITSVTDEQNLLQLSDEEASMTESSKLCTATTNKRLLDLPSPPAKRACKVSDWLSTCPRNDSQHNFYKEVLSVEDERSGIAISTIIIDQIVLQMAKIAVSKAESSKIPSPVPREHNGGKIRGLPFPRIMAKACHKAQESREDHCGDAEYDDSEVNNNDNLDDGSGKECAPGSVLSNEIVLQIADEAVSRVESSKMSSSISRKRNGGKNLNSPPLKKQVCQKSNESLRAHEDAAEDDDVEVIFVDSKKDEDLEIIFNDNLAGRGGQKRETKFATAEQIVLLMADIAVWISESSKISPPIPRKRSGGKIAGLVPLQPAKKRVVQKSQDNKTTTEDEDVEVIFID